MTTADTYGDRWSRAMKSLYSTQLADWGMEADYEGQEVLPVRVRDQRTGKKVWDRKSKTMPPLAMPWWRRDP
uniref:Uncharacterized protein n=1 Tax=viral metagenome TaxID=1070528 RepID=A0A6M3J3D9_9ZZZZ